MIRRCWVLSFVLLVSGLTACGEPPEPEAQLRALIAQAEQDAQEKSVRALMSLVADEYFDDRGNDRRAVEQMLRFHFLRNQRIFLATRITSIEVASDAQEAVVTVLVAMAGEPIPEDDFQLFRADAHHVDLEWVKFDDDWKLVAAEWRRATAGDVL